MKNYLDVSGHISVEGSKSILNRVLIIASYLTEPIKILNPSNCLDIITMLDNLEKLGVIIDRSEDHWMVKPRKKLKRNAELFINDSGTAYRFLMARTAAISRSKYIITTSEQLKSRPIVPLLEILEQMGSTIVSKGNAKIVNGSNLKGEILDLPADISSQFISAILLIAPSYNNDLELFLNGNIVSRTYIDMTIKIMQDFGVIVDFDGSRIFIQSGQEYNNLNEYYIEPDFSSACYFWALGALSKSAVSTNTIEQSSLQTDFNFLTILKKIGAKIEVKKDVISVCRNKIKGITIDMMDMPDQVPTLAVIALFADTKTIIKNIEHLQYKESNRINALVEELSRIGANVSYNKGALVITPLNKIPGSITLNSHHDHRLVMAFHILKLIFPQISITGSPSVEKSYPDFLKDIKSIKTLKSYYS
ncbi:MAG: 3-phosphoshikimate 1-carboxyvinyltransferase [Candidatus Tenebribacter mawsonii]|nr:3-phosphoshikimate 1-carboxyvinyltransferase [Candidatus Tenebribacter mawsonii]